jgi:hypothetical protein
VARRPIAGPTSTFSLVASSRKPAGATTGILRCTTCSAVTTPSAPPKWSAWLCVKTSALTGLSPKCWRAKAIAAAAVSRVVSVSTTIQPLRPSISVMFARSKPRSWWMPGATLNRPIWLFSLAWRHRLGLTVSGAAPSTKLKRSKSHTVRPSAART